MTMLKIVTGILPTGQPRTVSFHRFLIGHRKPLTGTPEVITTAKTKIGRVATRRFTQGADRPVRVKGDTYDKASPYFKGATA